MSINIESDISNLDKAIDTLTNCQPLTELEVKFICDKVFHIYSITSC